MSKRSDEEAKKDKPGQLVFHKGLPYCCSVELEPDFPSSICSECGAKYSSDDIVECMLTRSTLSVRTTPGAHG